MADYACRRRLLNVKTGVVVKNLTSGRPRSPRVQPGGGGGSQAQAPSSQRQTPSGCSWGQRQDHVASSPHWQAWPLSVSKLSPGAHSRSARHTHSPSGLQRHRPSGAGVGQRHAHAPASSHRQDWPLSASMTSPGAHSGRPLATHRPSSQAHAGAASGSGASQAMRPPQSSGTKSGLSQRHAQLQSS